MFVLLLLLLYKSVLTLNFVFQIRFKLSTVKTCSQALMIDPSYFEMEFDRCLNCQIVV